MSHHRFDCFHCDPDNWKLGIFYFCRADQRIFVPKRLRLLGWTINFARPLAVPFLGYFCLLVLSFLDLLKCLVGAGGDARFDLKILLALAVVGICYRLCKRVVSN